jgi:hypothetical protein
MAVDLVHAAGKVGDIYGDNTGGTGILAQVAGFVSEASSLACLPRCDEISNAHVLRVRFALKFHRALPSGKI